MDPKVELSAKTEKSVFTTSYNSCFFPNLTKKKRKSKTSKALPIQTIIRLTSHIPMYN